MEKGLAADPVGETTGAADVQPMVLVDTYSPLSTTEERAATLAGNDDFDWTFNEGPPQASLTRQGDGPIRYRDPSGTEIDWDGTGWRDANGEPVDFPHSPRDLSEGWGDNWSKFDYYPPDVPGRNLS